MNLGDLKDLAKFYLYEIVERKMSDTLLERILKLGVNDISQRMSLYPTDGTFTVTADQQEYRLSSLLTRYLEIDTPGIWWYDGSTWEEIDPRTMKYMDNKYPRWRDDSSGEPQRYFLRSDLAYIHPKPSSTQANGFKAYYIQAPQEMTQTSHTPFPIGGIQSNSEREDCKILSDTLCMYVAWKVLFALNKRKEALNRREEYMADIQEKTRLINSRLDIAHHDKTKFQGPHA